MSDDSIARSATTVSEAKTIAARFSGAEGARLLHDLLLRQPLVEGKDDIAHELSLVSQISPFETNETVIAQGAADTEIFLILVGSVVVSPNGREDTIRSAGTHVGEMATIDPAALRSATVRAREPSILVRVTEPDFSRVASAHPHIWRYLAREMADRLRQRVAKVPARKPISRVFIGSSSEGLSPAKALQGALPTDSLEVKLWTDDIFAASLTNIEALEAELIRADFAVLFLSPDDEVISRGAANMAPRDNLIAELGLFSGALGRRRTIMVCPKGVELKLPTDFLGENPIKYHSTDDMSPVVKQLVSIFESQGPR
jgi:CRP/FNR family transcriptional regulator, cyclic AMP receptor protein